MTTTTLSLEGFQDLLDRFGGGLDSWPDPHRSAAQALLTASAEARALLETAQALDDALRDTAKAPEGLIDRILAASGTTRKT